MLRERFSSLVWLFAALTFAVSIGFPNGYSVPIGLLFLCSASLFWLKVKWSDLNKDDKCLFYILMAFGLSMFAFVYMDDGDIRHIDKPSRFILVLPVLVLLLQVNDRRNWLWYGIIVGAFSAFLLALYERIVLGYGRAEGWEHPIMFGDTAMLLAMLNLAGSTFFLSQKKYILLTLSLLAALCGIGASVLSASRGGWVALPSIGLFILWQSRPLLNKKMLSTVIITSLAIIILIIAIPKTGVQQRISQTMDSLASYQNGENKNTSLGLRFEMWKASLHLFQDVPFFGAGTTGAKIEKQKLADRNIVRPEVAEYSHAHNEFINALALRGIVGFLFLLAVYLYPMRLFMKKMEAYKNDWTIKSYAMAGAIVPMCYIDFGLSQVMFSHNIGVMMYVFPIVYFWAAVRWAEKDKLHSSS